MMGVPRFSLINCLEDRRCLHAGRKRVTEEALLLIFTEFYVAFNFNWSSNGHA